MRACVHACVDCVMGGGRYCRWTELRASVGRSRALLRYLYNNISTDIRVAALIDS
jgi:hypothetical protein